MRSQITSLTIVHSTVYSGANQRKHQRSASLAFVRGIPRGPVNSPHKWPVTRKMFHLMTSSCHFVAWPVVVGAPRVHALAIRPYNGIAGCLGKLSTYIMKLAGNQSEQAQLDMSSNMKNRVFDPLKKMHLLLLKETCLFLYNRSKLCRTTCTISFSIKVLIQI